MKTIVILTHVGFDDSPYCRFVHDHAKSLQQKGYHVIVFAIISWFPVLSHFQKRKKEFMKRISKKEKKQVIDGVEVIYKKALSFSNFLYHSKINLNGYLYYRSIKNIFKRINEKEEVVLIDAHTFKTEGYVAYKLKKQYPDITTTITLHGASFLYNTSTKNGIDSIERIFKTVNYAVCVSKNLEKIAKSCNVKNTKVIYNGIRQNVFEEINKNDFKYQIISVGALKKYKNHNITIGAIKKLINKYPKLRLTIVGEGIERENLEKLVKELQLENVVEFKGQIENKEVLNLMNKSYIYLMPSVDEGFGIVYIEAMKAGCITIGTRNEGIDGFIKNGQNGFLVNPNVDEIVDLIDDIYSNKYDVEKIKENAISDVSELTWENNAIKYERLLKK